MSQFRKVLRLFWVIAAGAYHYIGNDVDSSIDVGYFTSVRQIVS